MPEADARLIPGPRILGRGVVVGPGDPVPAAWTGLPEVRITIADLAQRTGTTDRLHEAWVSRQPVVVRLEINRQQLREARSWKLPLWQLGERFEPWTDRLHFLVWNNNYDARGGHVPRWHWSRVAVQNGALDTPAGPTDVALPNGRAAWIDGGPRTAFPPGIFGGNEVVHYLGARDGLLVPLPALAAPRANLATDQLAAVSHPSGPARIIAPAGSGKTRVLTERLRHIIKDRGYERRHVLAVVYNKRAQEEMERRCTDFRPRIQTLNALGWEILREVEPGIELISDHEARQLMEKHCPALDHRANTDPLAPYLEALGIARQALRDPRDLETTRPDIEGFALAFAGYREELGQSRMADFDEQLYRTCETLLADGALRQRWQAKCRHLLVDEFQDLTPLHLLMIRLLAAPAFDVFGTGDDDQVIYGYSGADPRFLIDFASLFPGAAAHPLEVNYRCAPEIVTAAINLLSHNDTRVAKTIRADRSSDGSNAFSVIKHDVESTATTMLGIVTRWLADGLQPDQIAVLSRVNAALLLPLIAFLEAGLPVRVAMGSEILNRTGLRAVFAYLRLGLHPRDMSSRDLEEASRRPSRGFARELMTEIASRQHWSTDALRDLGWQVGGRDTTKLAKFLDDLELIQRECSRSTARALAAIRSVGLDKAMQRLDSAGNEASASHIDDLDALTGLAPLHPDAATFEAWLHEILNRERGRDGVLLSTIHKVKGEEWDRVIVSGVREGLLPHRLAEDIEEERRILHVGITRGRHQVIVLTEKERASPFIPELTVLRVAGAEPHVRPLRISPPGTERPRPRGARPDRGLDSRRLTVAAREGLELEAMGGHAGVVARIDPDGVSLLTRGGARLQVRFGERVKVNGETYLLTR